MPDRRFYYFILFLLLVNAGCNAQSADESNVQSRKAFIEIKFSKKGFVILNYLDSNYTSATIRLNNSTEGDNVISKEIYVNGPTVLSVVQNERKKLFNLSYLALPRDSLFMKLDNNYILSISKESSALDLNTIFGRQDFIQKPYQVGSIKFLLDSVKRTYLQNEAKIREFSAKQEFVEKKSQALQWYNKLLFYSNLFKINYQAYPLDSINANNELTEISKAVKSDEFLFTKIYSPLAKSIIYYLTQREARISNSSSSDVFINMKYLHSTFQRKKYFDGYFHDLLLGNENIVTTTQRANVVKMYKHFMFDTTSFVNKPAFNKLPIPSDVMNAKVKKLDGSNNTIKNLISSAKGKVILIDFWASWCAPCIAEVPYLKKASEKLKQKVIIYSMSIDSDASDWKKAAKKYNLISNSFFIENFESHQIVKFLKLNTIPRIILINSNGELLESDFLKPSNKNFSIILDDIATQQ